VFFFSAVAGIPIVKRRHGYTGTLERVTGLRGCDQTAKLIHHLVQELEYGLQMAVPTALCHTRPGAGQPKLWGPQSIGVTEVLGFRGSSSAYGYRQR